MYFGGNHSFFIKEEPKAWSLPLHKPGLRMDQGLVSTIIFQKYKAKYFLHLKARSTKQKIISKNPNYHSTT
jgi:hypothetical protein